VADDTGDEKLAVSWSRDPKPGDDLLLLLHGFEGTEHDLDDRFPELPESVVTVSLRAPVQQDAGHAWFLDDYGVSDTADTILGWLDDLASDAHGSDGHGLDEHGLDEHGSDGHDFASVGVLGVSQGGAMALELLRKSPERFAYAVQLSGILLGLDAAPELAKLHPPVFSGHGELDEIVPPPDVAATNEWLADHTALTVKQYVGMGHWISAGEATDVCAFIAGVLADRGHAA
jgi:phospholipase/carboxylesterase